MGIKLFINGPDCQSLAIGFEDSVTVGTGHKNTMDPTVQKVLANFTKFVLKPRLTAQIMAGFRAAVQDDTQVGILIP